MFKFRLNGEELYDQPDGWEEFTEAIVRSEDVHGFTLEYESDLVFVGDGYRILNTAFLENYCAELTLQIDYQCDGGYAPFLELLIKITDLDQNLERCTAQAKATDNGYYGMIHNNREVPVRLSAEYSKNNVPIAPCPTVDIAFIEPVGSGFPDVYPDNRMCYRDVDALAFVLRFITDNRITTVQSDYLDSLEFLLFLENKPMRFAFLSGIELRTANGISVEVSFAGIIKSMYALHNLFWRVDGTVLRLEPYDYFFQGMEIKLPFLRDLLRSTDTTKLYSKVSFGSAKSVDERFVSNTYPNPANWGMPFVDIIAHGKQEYPLTGVCQTDVTLNLISDYVYDSNAIEKVLYDDANLPTGERPDQSFDNDVFYVQYLFNEGAPIPNLTCFSAAFLLPTTPIRGWTFNPYFWHSNVITRHTVQSDLSLYQADSDDNFQAEAEAPNAYVQDFASPMVFIPPGDLTSQTKDQISVLFNAPGYGQTVGFPNLFPWGGFLNNSATTCLLPEAGCVVPPVNMQFNNDSTNGNFDPNDNWNTSDYYFECPATGVYGFRLEALINKVRDQVSYNPNVNNYFDINLYGNGQPGDPNERILFPKTVAIQMFLTVFDSSENVISEQVIPTYDPIDYYNLLYWELWQIPQGYPTNSIITSYVNPPGNPDTLINAVALSKWLEPGFIGQTWGEDYLFDRQGLIYLEQGQRLRPRIFISTLTHPTPIQAAQRVVEYGLRPGSIFKTFYVRSGGGNFAPVNPLLHRSLLYNFERPLTNDAWQEIKDNSAVGFEIGIGGTQLTQTHIGRIVRKIATGETNFEMVANRNQPYI
jgi:hypothetical protein